jgi:hypothetical protein
MYLNGANYKICSSLAIASTATVYSNSFLMRWVENFGVWILASSVSGAPSLQIQLQESYTSPATEGSADTNYVIGDGVADVYSVLNDELAHVKTLSPVPMQYGRYKIVGLASNPADTVITIVNFQQEPI